IQASLAPLTVHPCRPLVEHKVAVEPGGAEIDLRRRDLTQKRLCNGKAMHTEVLQGKGAFAVLRREFAASRPRRIIGAAMKVERENLADASATNNFHSALHDRVQSA